MVNNYKRDLKDILKNLTCETVSEIALQSGFNSRQAMDNWLRRRNLKILHQFAIVPIDRGVYAVRKNQKNRGVNKGVGEVS